MSFPSDQWFVAIVRDNGALHLKGISPLGSEGFFETDESSPQIILFSVCAPVYDNGERKSVDAAVAFGNMTIMMEYTTHRKAMKFFYNLDEKYHPDDHREWRNEQKKVYGL